MQIFDYPFSERIRFMLRIEDLLTRAIDNLQTNDADKHLLSLQSALQLVEITDRAEIKFELLQELVNQKDFLLSIKDKEVVNNEKVIKLLTDIENVILKLQNDSSKLGHHMRTNEWLMSLKQGFVTPGGICKFDTPSFQHWLELDPAVRRIHLSDWLRPMLPMQQAVYILLHLLRASGKTSNKLAKSGIFNERIGKDKPYHMLRIQLHDDLNFYPSISANKYAINVQFQQLDKSFVQQKVAMDVPFHLTLCRF